MGKATPKRERIGKHSGTAGFSRIFLSVALRRFRPSNFGGPAAYSKVFLSGTLRRFRPSNFGDPRPLPTSAGV